MWITFEPSLDGFALHPLRIKFVAMAPLLSASGNYRFWAQVKVGEDREESFIPFDLKI